MNKPCRVFVAAKSGGHIIPALTLAHQYRQEYPGATVLFFSGSSVLDRNLISHTEYVQEYLPASNIPKKIFLYPYFLVNIMYSFVRSFIVLQRYKPNSVISTGGVISIPIFLAARMLGIPTLLYELNVEPGKAVYYLSYIAHTVFVCFDTTKKFLPHALCALTSYPLRQLTIVPITVAREKLSIPQNSRVLFVLGGSQGSRFINQFIKQWASNFITSPFDCAPDFAKASTDRQDERGEHVHVYKNIFIIHQTGRADYAEMKEFYASHAIPAQVFDFIQDIEYYFSASDLIITRAGAGTLFEIAFFQKKAVIIPLITRATAHQKANAEEMARLHPALFTIIEQTSLEQAPETFSITLKNNLC